MLLLHENRADADLAIFSIQPNTAGSAIPIPIPVQRARAALVLCQAASPRDHTSYSSESFSSELTRCGLAPTVAPVYPASHRDWFVKRCPRPRFHIRWQGIDWSLAPLSRSRCHCPALMVLSVVGHCWGSIHESRSGRRLPLSRGEQPTIDQNVCACDT